MAHTTPARRWSVFVRPKGNGNQNGMTVNGQPYGLSNGETYMITATQMDVVLYNDHIHHNNGKAMGKWWITINAADATIVDGDEASNGGSGSAPAETARLVKVDPKTGATEQLMTLGRVYDGLAADGSGRFHATAGDELWLLDPGAQSETLLGSTQFDQVKGLEFAGTALYGFSVVNDRVVPFDATSGATIGSVLDVQDADLTSIVFTRLADLPSLKIMD